MNNENKQDSVLERAPEMMTTDWLVGLASAYHEFVPAFPEVKKLISEYMGLLRNYKSELINLEITIQHMDDECIDISCEFHLCANENCSFGWTIWVDVLFGDKADWSKAIEDYIRTYVPSWLMSKMCIRQPDQIVVAQHDPQLTRNESTT